jgi:hypothetical protein
MYPYSKNDTYPIHGFKEHYWYMTGASANSVDLGTTVPYVTTNRQYSMQSGPHVFTAYSVMKHLGITQDQYLVDLFYDTMYDPQEKYPKYAKTTKIAPYQTYGIDTLSNILLKYMWGASGGNVDIGTIGNRGISGEEAEASSGLRRIRSQIEEYTYQPVPVQFTSSNGDVITGFGVEYSTPNSSYGINRIIDGSFYFDVSGYDDITDPDTDFSVPVVYMNSIPAYPNLDLTYVNDGKYDLLYYYPNIGPTYNDPNNSDYSISYVVGAENVTQHSIQSILPAPGITQSAYIVSVIPINYLYRRRNNIIFGIGQFGISGDNGYTAENGMTYDVGPDSFTLTPVGDFAYVNIAGSPTNANDWYRVPMGVNGSIVSLDISNHPYSGTTYTNNVMHIRFFTERINVFAYEMNETIKFKQNDSVYSK